MNSKLPTTTPTVLKTKQNEKTEFLEFDKLNLRLIGKINNTKSKCFFYEKIHLPEAYFLQNTKNDGILYHHSFFSAIRDILDLTLLFISNEELSNTNGRIRYPELFECLIKENYFSNKIITNNGIKELDIEYINLINNEFIDLFKNKYNQILGSHMLDLEISIFSSFEKHLSSIFEKYYSDHKNKLILSRKTKIELLINKYINEKNKNTNTQCTEKIILKILKNPGEFISFPDRLNSIMKNIDIKLYPRKLDKDLLIIDFIRQKRNTIHNNGIHSGNDVKLEFKEKIFALTKNNPAKSNDWCDDIDLLGELIDIYSAIVSAIPTLSFTELIKTETPNNSIFDE